VSKKEKTIGLLDTHKNKAIHSNNKSKVYCLGKHGGLTLLGTIASEKETPIKRGNL